VSAATIKRLDPTQVELEIAIPKEELDAARERAFRHLVKNVRIPGFRPGKAPRKIFEAQYGTSAIEERAIDSVVPGAYSKALAENDLVPVDEPQMELLPEEEGQPLRVRATVAVRPEIELHDYKGVEVEGPSIAIGDEEVEAALEGLRKESATLVPVDRPVATGDVPTLDFEGKIDGVAFQGGKAEGQPTEIDAERFIPGFTEGIIGMKAGETKDVEAQFPAGYGNAELAGKTAVFTVTVHDNKVPELPELDDEFARRFAGPEATLDTLRAELRERLEAGARARRRRAVSGPILEKLGASHAFALPEVLVERNVQALESEAREHVARDGREWEAYLTDRGKTEDELRAEFRTEAERRVKTTLLIEAIAKAEKIQATPQDVEAEVRQLSREYGQPREAILEMLRNNYGALIDGIVRTKTLEFLADHAAVSEIQPVAAAGEAQPVAAASEAQPAAAGPDAAAEPDDAGPGPQPEV
jgi:trigger factor